MTIKHPGRALALATLLILTSQVARAETSAEACDRLAAHAGDPTLPKNIPGVRYDDIIAEPAIKACAEAVAAEPGNMRYHHQYGRALNVGKKFDEALAEFTIAANGKHWVSNAAIGDMYYFGDFGTPDYVKAFEFNLKAAENGVMYAAENAAGRYRDGVGVAKDPVKSYEWLQKAYALGSMDAAVDIGWAYEHGLVVKADKVEALRWYRIAAAKNHAIGMNNVGYFYAEGIVVPMDKAVALEWFRKAEAGGAPIALFNIAEALDNGWAIEKSPKLAADYVVKGFGLGNKDVDAENRDNLFRDTWSPDFWRELQILLKAGGHYSGPINGQLTDATKAAVNKIVDQ